jgi:hypothetical protein
MGAARRRVKQTSTLEQRLVAEAKLLREKAAKTPPGLKRERLLRRARQHETLSRI